MGLICTPMRCTISPSLAHAGITAAVGLVEQLPAADLVLREAKCLALGLAPAPVRAVAMMRAKVSSSAAPKFPSAFWRTM